MLDRFDPFDSFDLFDLFDLFELRAESDPAAKEIPKEPTREHQDQTRQG